MDVLHHLTGIHHHHIVRHLPDDTHVVGDKDDAGAEIPFDVVDQPQNLRLHGHIQRRRRFVTDKHGGIVAQCHGNDDTLAHTAGEFPRNRMKDLFRHRDAHLFDQMQGTLVRLCSADALVRQNCLGNLAATGHQRVEAGHRLLEDQCDLAATLAGQLLFRHTDQLFTAQLHAAPRHTARCRHHLQDAIDRHALAAAAFADNTDGLTLLEGEGHIIHRGQHTPLRKKGDGKMLHRQYCF